MLPFFYPVYFYFFLISIFNEAEYDVYPGSRVACLYDKYNSDGNMYECTLIKEDKNGLWTVAWYDGDKDNLTGHPLDDIRKIVSVTQEVKHFFLFF